MPRYSYERLSAQDASFLFAERPAIHMHVAATAVFQAGPMRTPDGGIDFERFKRAVEGALHRVPRYRQRLKWIPFENHPVWVDDRQFNLDYHIRHTALPRPGGAEQLKHLSARIMSQPLDRARPLWEMWLVEGLDGDRFATITKTHHCVIDGMAGADLAQILLSISPEQETAETVPYIPRPAPSSLELWLDSWGKRLAMPLRIVRELADLSLRGDGELRTRMKALGELLGWVVMPASETPMNGRLGPHRRFDWLETELAHVKALRKAFDCSVNDIILATVAGAVRDFLQRRRVRPERIDFRVSAPVSVRNEQERGQMGNRVSSWIVRLPLEEEDARARVVRIREATRELKASNQALGVDTIMKMAEFTPSMLMSLGVRAASGPINMIVTNVPGPQFPLFMLGAELQSLFPVVPLLDGTGVGIALFSYNGKLCWGFNGDFELMPDMRALVSAVARSFEELAKAAGVSLEPSRPASVKQVIDLRTAVAAAGTDDESDGPRRASSKGAGHGAAGPQGN
jgi:diacylglycerol O-acyltransferase / wax synthase